MRTHIIDAYIRHRSWVSQWYAMWSFKGPKWNEKEWWASHYGVVYKFNFDLNFWLVNSFWKIIFPFDWERHLNSAWTQYVCDKSDNARVCAKWQWNARDGVTGLHDRRNRECNPVTPVEFSLYTIPHLHSLSNIACTYLHSDSVATHISTMRMLVAGSLRMGCRLGDGDEYSQRCEVSRTKPLIPCWAGACP